MGRHFGAAVGGPSVPACRRSRHDRPYVRIRRSGGVSTSLLFGLAPAGVLFGSLRLTRGRGNSDGRRPVLLHTSLVAVQVATTVVLLVAAGFLGTSVLRLLRVDPGFTVAGLFSVGFDAPETARDSRSVALFQALVMQTIQEIPGVTSVSLTTALPFPGGDGARSFAREPDGPMSEFAMWHRSVAANYLDALGVQLLEGRLLPETDGSGAPNAIVVSRSFAERVWPGESAVGKRVYRTGPDGAWTVVRVVGDVHEITLARAPEPTIYRTLAQTPSRRVYLVARTSAAGTREIGIRMLLGESVGRIGLRVFRLGMAGALLGVTGGLPIAYVTAGALGLQLFATSPTELWMYASAAVLAIGACASAAFFPSRRVVRLSPLVVVNTAG
jgi:putative ABC transport system permease protein